MLKKWLYNLIVVFSHTVNTLLFGDPHESISVRTGRAMKRNPNGWYRFHGAFINWLFRTFLNEEDHLGDAVDGENKAIELWRW